MKKSFLSKIKDFFYELSHSSDYTKDFLFKSDIRSNVFIGTTVICLELFMLLRLKFKSILKVIPQDSDWVKKHVCAYLILLAAASVL
ncbi:MAG: hypothetical protein J5817_04865, partial [Treponema sp.]|nr:hypothetical protein [Treponema sp.]